jgi:hypothetical protein
MKLASFSMSSLLGRGASLPGGGMLPSRITLTIREPLTPLYAIGEEPHGVMSSLSIRLPMSSMFPMPPAGRPPSALSAP